MIGFRKYFVVEVIDDKISYRALYKKNISSSSMVARVGFQPRTSIEI